MWLAQLVQQASTSQSKALALHSLQPITMEDYRTETVISTPQWNHRWPKQQVPGSWKWRESLSLAALQARLVRLQGPQAREAARNLGASKIKCRRGLTPDSTSIITLRKKLSLQEDLCFIYRIEQKLNRRWWISSQLLIISLHRVINSVIHNHRNQIGQWNQWILITQLPHPGDILWRDLERILFQHVQ